MVEYIIFGFFILLICICVLLHIVILRELKSLSDDLTDTYNDFRDEMLLLAETLQVYHELLNDYQIPMIPVPTKQEIELFSNDW